MASNTAWLYSWVYQLSLIHISALTLLADGLIMAMVYRTCFTTDDQYQTPKAR